MKPNPQVDDMLGDSSDSQLLKLGWAALKRTNSEDTAKRLPSVRQTTSDPLASPDPKCPFNLVVSLVLYFVGERGDRSLTRGAERRDIAMLMRHLVQRTMTEHDTG
jgi:hypothetical protein